MRPKEDGHITRSMLTDFFKVRFATGVREPTSVSVSYYTPTLSGEPELFTRGIILLLGDGLCSTLPSLVIAQDADCGTEEEGGGGTGRSNDLCEGGESDGGTGSDNDFASRLDFHLAEQQHRTSGSGEHGEHARYKRTGQRKPEGPSSRTLRMSDDDLE